MNRQQQKQPQNQPYHRDIEEAVTSKSPTSNSSRHDGDPFHRRCSALSNNIINNSNELDAGNVKDPDVLLGGSTRSGTSEQDVTITATRSRGLPLTAVPHGKLSAVNEPPPRLLHP